MRSTSYEQGFPQKRGIQYNSAKDTKRGKIMKASVSRSMGILYVWSLFLLMSSSARGDEGQNKALVGTKFGWLYQVDLSTGQVEEKNEMPEPTYSLMMLDKRTALIGGTRTLYRVDIQQRTEVALATFDSPVTGVSLIKKGEALVTTEWGEIWRIDLKKKLLTKVLTMEETLTGVGVLNKQFAYVVGKIEGTSNVYKVDLKGKKTSRVIKKKKNPFEGLSGPVAFAGKKQKAFVVGQEGAVYRILLKAGKVKNMTKQQPLPFDCLGLALKNETRMYVIGEASAVYLVNTKIGQNVKVADIPQNPTAIALIPEKAAE